MRNLAYATTNSSKWPLLSDLKVDQSACRARCRYFQLSLTLLHFDDQARNTTITSVCYHRNGCSLTSEVDCSRSAPVIRSFRTSQESATSERQKWFLQIYFAANFSFDFCTTGEELSPAENLGQVVFGERIRPSPYKVSLVAAALLMEQS